MVMRQDISEELVTEARRVCKKYCRAKFCDEGCTNTWPGDGSGAWFDINFDEAMANLKSDDGHTS